MFLFKIALYLVAIITSKTMKPVKYFLLEKEFTLINDSALGKQYIYQYQQQTDSRISRKFHWNESVTSFPKPGKFLWNNLKQTQQFL